MKFPRIITPLDREGEIYVQTGEHAGDPALVLGPESIAYRPKGSATDTQYVVKWDDVEQMFKRRTEDESSESASQDTPAV